MLQPEGPILVMGDFNLHLGIVSIVVEDLEKPMHKVFYLLIALIDQLPSLSLSVKWQVVL